MALLVGTELCRSAWDGLFSPCICKNRVGSWVFLFISLLIRVRVSLCSLDWFGSPRVDQAGLRLKELCLPVLQRAGIDGGHHPVQLCTITHCVVVSFKVEDAHSATTFFNNCLAVLKLAYLNLILCGESIEYKDMTKVGFSIPYSHIKIVSLCVSIRVKEAIKTNFHHIPALNGNLCN